jgi:hypothetical protein
MPNRNRNVDCLPLLRIREPRVACSSFEGETLAVLSKTDLIASTPNTRTDVGILMKEFQCVRSNGCAIIDQELEIGLCSIAVPLEYDRGQTVAAVNIGAPAVLVPASEMVERSLPLLCETQRALPGCCDKVTQTPSFARWSIRQARGVAPVCFRKNREK